MIKLSKLVTIGTYNYLITRSKFYVLLPRLKSNYSCEECENFESGECRLKLELEQNPDIKCSDYIIYPINGYNGKLITEIIDKSREDSITKCQDNKLIKAFMKSFCSDSCPYNPDGCGTIRCQFDSLIKELENE